MRPMAMKIAQVSSRFNHVLKVFVSLDADALTEITSL